MSEPLAIAPHVRGFSGNAQATLDGNKSINNRALILACLRNGMTLLEGVSYCDDTTTMFECLKKAGFNVWDNRYDGDITVSGCGGNIPDPDPHDPEGFFDVQNAGTVARFLPALLSLKKNGHYSFMCDDAMKKRPMKSLFKALMQLGCTFKWDEEEWCYPFDMDTKGNIEDVDIVEVDISETTQGLSALMLIQSAPQAHFVIKITGDNGISKPHIDMTRRMIEQFGKFKDGETVEYYVEADLTAFANFAMLPLLHDIITNEEDRDPSGAHAWFYFDGGADDHLDPDKSLQGDMKFFELLYKYRLINLLKKPGEIFVFAGGLRKGIDADFREFSDCFPAFTIIAPFLNTPTTIRGIKHTRKQECDRIEAVAKNLRLILGDEFVKTTEDSITIIPPAEYSHMADYLWQRQISLGDKPYIIETFNDHRIAMAFSILGTFPINGSRSWITIDNPDCCDKSCPCFYSELDDIYYYFKEPFEFPEEEWNRLKEEATKYDAQIKKLNEDKNKE